MSFVCHSYVIRLYLYVNRISLVYAHILSVCLPYVTRMSLYVILVSSVCGFTIGNPGKVVCVVPGFKLKSPVNKKSI